MKTIRLAISAAALISSVCGAHAIKLCQLDWLNAWKNLGNSTALSGMISHSQGNRNDTGNGGIGRWAVTSAQGGAGAYHTVSGESFCSSASGGAYTYGNPSFADSPSNNKNCWCRMSAPNLGASWVFLFSNSVAADCATYCAPSCAECVSKGTSGSCARSSLLALP
jgi:hypothetical protein